MGKSFKGEIKARIIEARFAQSGKVSNVSKHTGDNVKKWDLIASLDRKILQTELDRQLADYEKVRADFEVYNQRNKEPQNDLEKYLKAEKQASLNASVKDVEIAKARLDQNDLFSPVDGVILNDGDMAVGLYVTPANSPVSIVDTGSYYFEFEIGQKDIPDFPQAGKCKVKIDGMKDDMGGETGSVFSDGKKFSIKVKLAKTDNLLLGMKGEVKL